jgi:hypothetical protein
MSDDLVLVADVDREPIRWLWPERIPLGKVTVLDGDPGTGKSTLTLTIAAKVTTGSPFPDGSRPERSDAILLSAEDDIADTIRPRWRPPAPTWLAAGFCPTSSRNPTDHPGRRSCPPTWTRLRAW